MSIFSARNNKIMRILISLVLLPLIAFSCSSDNKKEDKMKEEETVSSKNEVKKGRASRHRFLIDLGGFGAPSWEG